ncbi:MAG: hypothetical protein IT379_13140 [Deltaproteobacteria bacterium]|nr:hypothetical protein [Deltaproteobacteria bacterium]
MTWAGFAVTVARDGCVELYRNAECAVFQYAAQKGSEDVVAKLATFEGTLTATASSSVSRSRRSLPPPSRSRAADARAPLARGECTRIPASPIGHGAIYDRLRTVLLEDHTTTL